MKLLLLLFFFSVVSAEQYVTEQLRDIVDKYKHLTFGNSEFSNWIEQVYYASKKPMGFEGEKYYIFHNFRVYDGIRQQLENQITDRINQLESQMPNRKLSQACVTDFQAKISRLQHALKSSNSEKTSILDRSLPHCTEKDEKPKKRKKNSSNYDYWYWWWWG